MKKNIAAVGLFVLSFVLVSTTLIADAKAELVAPVLSLQDLSTQLKTPELIAKYMWKNFSEEADRRHFGTNEYWQNPEEFLQNKKGDCEDFALFAKTLLKAAGYQTFLLNVYADGFAHTVAVFKQDGKYNVIDGAEIKYFEAESLEELSEKIHPLWNESAIVMKASEQREGRVLKLIDRLHAEYAISTYA